MTRLGTVKPASREPVGIPAAETVAPSERIETPFAEMERRAGGASVADPAALGPAGARYRRVFACATGSTDSPDEARAP